jgi:hypothetical protein
MATAAPCRDDERRRHPRFRLDASARLRPNDWSTVQVGMLDISSHGFRARCAANLKIGGYVTLEVNGIGQVDAKILWRHAEEVGARFSRPISLDYCSWVREPLDAVKENAGEVADEDLFEQLARRAERRAAEMR